MIPGGDPVLMDTDSEISILLLSICNTDPGPTVFYIYKSSNGNDYRLTPDLTLDAPSLTGRGAFIYQNFVLDSSFSISVKIISGSADVDLNWQPILR
jgi:hypothetical protein